MFPLPIFPTNGFDTSILTPVLVGMGFLAIFAETLGWPFVGLVVPGYIAAVAIAAPASAITILAESFATFFLSRVVGIWIPESGAWTTFFGRERFFLLILSSVVVRLASEGFVLPYLAAKFGFGYASELYSIGLVLVPLVANAFWNIGFARGLWQMAVVTGLTFLVIKWVLLPGTNLTLSRFELTYESVALDFLASSKAYVILLAGTMLAARSNVRFGWDFNGILVPGLLTVAWYDPVKLVSTFVEAFIVAWLARKVVGLPIFQRALIEGPLLTVLVFIVGYLVKYSEGFIAMFAFPGEQITDFYGFGYVLPSLLAVKVWQKTSPGRVLMPAFQVSVAGFLVGNLVGYLFTVAIPYTEDNALEGEVRMTRSASLTSDAALHVVAQKNLDSPDTPVGRSVIALVASARGRGRGIDFALRACSGEGLRVSNTTRAAGGQWWSLRRSTDGESGDGIPLVAVTRSPKASGVVLGLTAKDSRGVIVASRVANAARCGRAGHRAGAP
ncbi:MAG: poly-gamma-glutamate biosynthesis protein PgsC/CapC [Polyangiales bacterium]